MSFNELLKGHHRDESFEAQSPTQVDQDDEAQWAQDVSQYRAAGYVSSHIDTLAEQSESVRPTDVEGFVEIHNRSLNNQAQLLDIEVPALKVTDQLSVDEVSLEDLKEWARKTGGALKDAIRVSADRTGLFFSRLSKDTEALTKRIEALKERVSDHDATSGGVSVGKSLRKYLVKGNRYSSNPGADVKQLVSTLSGFIEASVKYHDQLDAHVKQLITEAVKSGELPHHKFDPEDVPEGFSALVKAQPSQLLGNIHFVKDDDAKLPVVKIERDYESAERIARHLPELPVLTKSQIEGIIGEGHEAISKSLQLIKTLSKSIGASHTVLSSLIDSVSGKLGDGLGKGVSSLEYTYLADIGQLDKAVYNLYTEASKAIHAVISWAEESVRHK